MNPGHWFLAVGIVLLHGSPSRAQLADTSESRIPAGSHALEFQVHNLVSLGSFLGSTISYKRYLRNHALRVGVSLNYNSYDRTGDRMDRTVFQELDSTVVDNYDLEEKFAPGGASIQTQFLFYARHRETLDTYWGLGPLLGYSSRNQIDKQWPQDTTGNGSRSYYGYEIRRLFEDFYAGVVASVGFEWSLRKHFSLVAEYSSTVKYGLSRNLREERRMRWSTFQQERITILNELDQTTSGPLFAFSSGVKFGLVVWF